ncbi:spermidine Putrescine ABC transporter permease component potC [Halarchaeum acidiphilum MH1-52-1]|uniref:Spermidine Putrescine ABC transporter permease component potC n=1 Tax=Halarchaeum acidiphilum MH1-52-1 TaxID=1261545 RepID=U2YDT2_9EURY|nr:spermidine Putrescine ABC transporter permease component potC [Halarchaeum acidiphilum MH1-52-1]
MLFIGLPLCVVLAVSVTSGQFLSFPPKGFSLKWFGAFFASSDWMNAMRTSLEVALGAAVISTTIGSALAFALDRYEYSYGGLLAGLGVLPVLLPPVIVGVAFMIFFYSVGFSGTVWNLMIAHGIFYSPFPFILISQGLDEIDQGYEEAAMNLGATPTYTLRTITIPLLRSNVISGAIFAFILSLNEYIIAWLLSGFVLTTIPIQIFTSLRYSYSPVIAAVSVIFVFITVVVMSVIDYLSGGIWE